MENEKESILLRLFNEKVVTFIAIFIAFGYLLPFKQGFNFGDIHWAVLWLIGGIFTWKRKTWAAILLAMLAVYDLLRLVLDFQTLRSDVQDWSADFDLAESTIFTLGVTVYSVATGMLLCVLFYGICTVITKWNKQDLEM
jgi:hypothetical protein